MLEQWLDDRRKVWQYGNNLRGDYNRTWCQSYRLRDVGSDCGNCWWALLDKHPNAHSPALSRPLCISHLHLWMLDSLELPRTWLCKEQLPQHLSRERQNSLSGRENSFCFEIPTLVYETQESKWKLKNTPKANRTHHIEYETRNREGNSSPLIGLPVEL